MSARRPHLSLTRGPIVGASALVLLLAAGCGGGADEAAAPEEPAASSSAASEPDEPSESESEPSESESEESEEPEAAEEVVITISDFEFDVPETVAPGAQITIMNEDSAFHTVTAEDGTFDVDAPSGEPVTFTAPDEPGEYAFACTPHPSMTATLVVG